MALYQIMAAINEIDKRWKSWNLNRTSRDESDTLKNQSIPSPWPINGYTASLLRREIPTGKTGKGTDVIAKIFKPNYKFARFEPQMISTTSLYYVIEPTLRFVSAKIAQKKISCKF